MRGRSGSETTLYNSENTAMIPKKVASVEVIRWVLKTRGISILALAILCLMVTLIGVGLEAYAFIIGIGSMGLFVYHFVVSDKMVKYLKKKYNI